MSVTEFKTRLPNAHFGRNDKKYFPLWVRRYESFLMSDSQTKRIPSKRNVPAELIIETSLVMGFCRDLLKSKTPAWQRLQAVRAIEAYRNLVLGVPQPCLLEMKKTLARLAESEKYHGSDSSGNLQAHVIVGDRVGMIDSSEPAVIQEFRRELRLQYRKPATEKSYVKYARDFIRYCGSDDLRKFSEFEIRGFLSSSQGLPRVAAVPFLTVCAGFRGGSQFRMAQEQPKSFRNRMPKKWKPIDLGLNQASAYLGNLDLDPFF